MLLSVLPLFLSHAAAQLLPGSTVCAQIAASIAGDVYYPSSLSTNFAADIQHYFASSQQTPTCVVEVDSIEDISHVVELVGSTRTPFSVVSGGHSCNQGFSSTTGVYISLVRVNQITLSSDKSTVEIGLGNRWTDVYAALNGTGVNVVGGRVPGPGVGGVSLGGGYSWLTNQYGLTVDTIESYNLVLPNGTIALVDEKSEPDLFFALKGGLNRFGVVYSINYKTVPQPNLVYAGSRYYGSNAIDAITNATARFHAQNTDPKAEVIYTINGGLYTLGPNVILIMFYDGPEKPAIFDLFDVDVSPEYDDIKIQSFADFENSVPSKLSSGSRGSYHTLSLTGLTVPMMNAIHNETVYYGSLSIVESAIVVSFDIEPFLTGSNGYGKWATDSAYPHANSPLPLNLFWGWELEEFDTYWHGIMQQSVNYLTQLAKSYGLYDSNSYAYPNYALYTYSGAQVYGPTNAARMRAIQSKNDPDGVMSGLTGGFDL